MLKRKILCVLFLIIFSVTSLVAQQKVAMRCLQISKDFLARSEWTNACAQAELGTVYDDSISDLWYVSAEAKYRSGQKPAQVLPLVITALEKNNWVDNNKDNARLLYARLLCDTNDYYGALKQLDTAPMIYSAEAEYIRILSYYHIGTEESYSKAREKLSVVSKLFPNDNRFPLVFFTQELKEDLTFDKEAAVLAQVFSKRFTNPTEKSVKNSAELFIYAAAFADEDLQERMLKAFDSAGLRHPMFSVIALKAGVLTETEAYEYFCSYASESMTLKNLVQFASLIKSDEVKDALKTFLASFNGFLSDNLHGDNCIKLIAKYERGRPQYISFDDNLDGIPEWKINCDFGSPLSVVFSDNISLTYKEYPYLSSVIADDISYSLVPNLYEWTPVKFDLNKKLEELIGENSFIVPEPLKTSFDLNQSDLIKYSSSFKCPGYER
ncbi:MAG: hypothetical protein IKZ04_02395, partial [Spirochaetaceae bacterium]|nr:hypothetical protein [Spirochaetaceae bacterium]